MIQLNNAHLSFGQRILFNRINLTIKAGQKVGLVGRNGSGKSTLLKAIGNPDMLDSGSITVLNGKTIAYMPQEVVLTSIQSIVQEAFNAFATIAQLNKQLVDLEPFITTDEKKAFRYSDLHLQLAELEPERALAETKKMLMGLGFKEQQFDQPVAELSVGWKMRIVLAKLLLQKADFYLFDEPTNHLDIVAKDWFIQFLQKAPFGFLLVCHEQHFLDTLCNTIIELENSKATMYKGNYSKYLVQKEHNQQLLEQQYEQQQKDIKQKKATVERFRASATKAKMAQSMLKSLEKIERIELHSGPKTANITFAPIEQPGRTVLTVKNVAHAFENKKLFENVNLTIERKEKVAIIAPNGVGKSTLFNIIIGKLKQLSGFVEFGHNVKHAFFAQDHHESLDINASIWDNVNTQCAKTDAQVRSFLGAFLFSNDDVHKKVSVLSGGELNRVRMVIALLQDANFLLLDEPTNHLDLQTKEILLNALQNYQGTILFVSHDHMFINQLATRVIELTETGTTSYHGNYDDYLQQSEHAASIAQAPTSKKTTEPLKNSKAISGKDQYERNKKIKKLESSISKLEHEIQKTENKFEQAQYGTDPFSELQKKLAELNSELENKTMQWEQLLEQLTP